MRGDGAILINDEGKRFINELQTRDVVSQSILKQPGAHVYLVFNDDLVKQNKTINSYFKQKLVAEGDTPEALANAIKVDAKQLPQTLKTYTGYAKANKGTKFGRDSFKQALDTGKYYAIEVTPGIHHTMGGIAINTKAQVVNKDGKVISNLFAAGEAAGSVHGANRLGGNSLADIVTSGRIGADEAVKEIKAGK